MKLTLLLCFLFIQMGRIDPVDSAAPPAVKDTYQHPDNISFQLICPETSVDAVAGHPVILKCYTKPELKVKRVEWSVNGSDEVHLFREGKDNYIHQNEKYKGKTSLFKDELYRGNSSLNLTADMSHSGNYCCFVYAKKFEGKCYITVNVHPEGEDDTFQMNRGVTVSPDKPNNGKDRQDKIQQDNGGVVAGAVIGGLVVAASIIALVVYFWRRRLKHPQSQRKSNSPSNDQAPGYELQALKPPQDEGNEPVAQNPEEEQNQMIRPSAENLSQTAQLYGEKRMYF